MDELTKYVVMFNLASETISKIAAARGLTFDEAVQQADRNMAQFFEANNRRIKELEAAQTPEA